MTKRKSGSRMSKNGSKIIPQVIDCNIDLRGQNIDEFFLALGSNTHIKANKFAGSLPNVNVKMIDVILRGE